MSYRRAHLAPESSADSGAGPSQQTPIMRAWLGGNIPRALEIAAAVPPGDPLHAAAQAILKGVAFDDGQCGLQDALAAHDLALQSPPRDVDLYASLLRNAVYFSVSVNRLVEARRLLRELGDLEARVHPRLRLVGPMARWWLARAQDDYPAQLAAIEQGFALVEREGAIPPERVGLARLNLHWQRLESALANHDLTVAEREVAPVRDLQSHSLHAGWWPWQVLSASFLELTGRYESGLARLKEMTPEQRRPNAKAADVTEAALLIRLGRLAPADAIIERLARRAGSEAGQSEGPAEVAEVDVAALRGLRALAARDLGAVWEASEEMTRATRRDHPNWSGKANELLAEAELVAGRLKLTRRLLEREDPDRTRLRCRMLWVRLCWQEGDHAAAAEGFTAVLNDVLPDYPGYVARQLQFALELSAYDAARLWAMAIGAVGARVAPAGVKPVGVKSSEPEAPLPRGTLGRRGQLLRLFERHGRLTRAQVAALLRCAPNTATRDLEALAREGTVRRVETSGHLRTSYFVLTAGPNASA